MKTGFHDAMVCIVLLLLTILFAFGCVRFDAHPNEDAAILMRYASHLAEGHGIVWNVGETPVDGATDFLFMVAVAFLHFSGFDLETAARLLSVGSHLLTVVLIYLSMRHLQRSGVLPAVLSSFFFAIGPGLSLAAVSFGTPFFTLFVSVTWVLALRIIQGHRSTTDYIRFSICGLVTGLIRPEGVLIAGFMLTAIYIMIGVKEMVRLVVCFGSVFLSLGGAYFIWRWWYFGYPLPNPFYKKGGGHLYLFSLLRSIRNTLFLCYLFVPAFLLSLRSKSLLKLAICYAFPIVGATAMWILLSDEMNFGMRFQYPLLAIAALSWYPLVASLQQDFRLPRFWELDGRGRVAVLVVASAVLLGVFSIRITQTMSMNKSRNHKYDIGVILSEYADRGYTICTTEAGLLPLYSRWRAIDAWGLNDPWIAHNGGITESYLAGIKPEIIMWHGYFSPLSPLLNPQVGIGPRWHRMVETLKSYAQANNYVIAAAFGVSPFETEYYCVSRDMPECDEVVSRIRSTRYGGVNYATFKQDHP